MAKGQSDADQIKETHLRSSGKVAQDSPEAKYMGPDSGPFMCAHCEFFVGPNSCVKVEGYIDPNGCCNLFDPDDDAESEENDD